MSDIADIKTHRAKLRRDNDIEAVLSLCNQNNVTLVELEEASKRFIDRYEEIEAGLKDSRRKVMLSNRARHAARTRWDRARAFLTSHLDRKEKLARDFGGVNVDLGNEVTETAPKPEKIYFPMEEL